MNSVKTFLKRQCNKHIIFSHSTAQKYELHFAIDWTKKNFLRLYPHIMNKKIQKNIISEEFFVTKESWLEFISHIDDKVCLEIGSGPAGALVRWFWAKERHIIDPLIQHYKNTALKLYNKTWFTPDITLYPQAAELVVASLIGKIDGVIVCRNALDHCDNPDKVLENIGLYAAPGCILLLWTDLYHSLGHDEGHRNVTKNTDAFIQQIEQLGFTMNYVFSDKNRKTINVGVRATKN